MLISIVIPAYNRAHVISKTLDSIIAQDYQDWECIIADDHSTDNTMQILKEYAMKDSRIKVFENERKKGAQGARNTAVLHSSADWICIFDSDDYMYPNYLSEMTNAISDSVDVVVCHSDVINLTTGLKIKTLAPCCYRNVENDLYGLRVYVPNNQTLIRKSKIKEIGMLDEDCPSMQEWDTHLRLSRVCDYTTVEKVLVDYYVGGRDTISSDTKREVKGRMYILRKHIGEWRKRPIALLHFTNQIYTLIIKNKDTAFVKEAKNSLKQSIPLGSIYIYVLSLKDRIHKPKCIKL